MEDVIGLNGALMLTCSLFLNNFQESLSCRRYETWSWTEFLSPGKHAKPAQTQKTCSVQAVHPYLHEQEQPWPRLEQVFPFFSVHISSCTCVAWSISWLAYVAWHKTGATSVARAGIPPNQDRNTSLFCYPSD